MPIRGMLLHLAGVVTGLAVCLAGALWLGSGEPAHVALGALLFAAGAAGVALQGWYAVKRLRGGGRDSGNRSQGEPTSVQRRGKAREEG